MNIRQIKKQLKRECDSIVPNQRERILMTVGAPSQKKAKKSSALKWLIPSFGAVCLCVVLALSLFLPMFSGGGGGGKLTLTNSVVVLEVNPVFEISANSAEKVTAVRGLNKQAVMLLDGNESTYKDNDLSVALASITKLVASANYVKKDVKISATCGNSDYEKQLEQKIAQEVKKALDASSVSATVSSKTKHQDSKKMSKKYNVSEQKMSLCLELADKNSALKIDELVKRDTDDLLEMLYNYDSGKMEKFMQDLAKNNELVDGKKNELLAQLDNISSSVGSLLEQIPPLVEKQDIIELNKILVKLRTFYVEEIFDGEITLENYEDFSEEAAGLKEELEESIVEAREELDEKYADWVKAYDKALKKGVDGDDDFDFDDLEFDFELELDFKLPNVK